MLSTPRSGLAFGAAAVAFVCLGLGFVTSRFGRLATLFEPGSVAAPFAWVVATVLAGAVALCVALAVGAKPGVGARATIALLALAARVASLLHAQLLAPFIALVAWSAIAFWREGSAAR